MSDFIKMIRGIFIVVGAATLAKDFGNDSFLIYAILYVVCFLVLVGEW